MGAEKTNKPLIGLTCRWDDEKRRLYLPAEYSEAVAAAGGVPVLIPLIPGTAAELAAVLDGIVLTGSASDMNPARYHQDRHRAVTTIHEQRDETDFQILGQVFADKKPVLGVCFGMQSLNVYLGGSLVQDIPASVTDALAHNSNDARHEVTIEPESRMARWAAGPRATVNSTHHQAIDRPGRGLRIAARSADGVIEAVEAKPSDQFVFAVQWHPERIWREEPLSARLFDELVKAASAFRVRTAGPLPRSG